MNQVIAWQYRVHAAHYRDVGARWLAEHRGLNFLQRFRILLFQRLVTGRMTIFLFSAIHLVFLIFFSAQHFDTRPSNKGDEHINATHGGRLPYTADTGSFQI